MDFATIISTIIGVIIGGVITWAVSRYYYIRSGEELREEAYKIRNLNKIILEALEQANLAEIVRDKSGNIIGLKRLIIHPAPVDAITLADEVKVEIGPPAP